VDVYFAGGVDNFPVIAPVVAPYPLADLLPSLASVPAEYKTNPFGIETQGRWPIVHRSQLVIGYDSSRISETQVPRNFEALLSWAQAHPKQMALTSPAKGGSGQGFVYSAALALVKEPTCRKTLTDATVTRSRAEAWALQASCLDPLWAYLTRLSKVVELTNGNADTLNLMNNRQALLGTVWEDHAATFVRAKLLPDSFRVTSLQPALVSGGDGLIVAANGKSPAAALLFVDMAFGRDFQAWKLEHHASRSPRPDVDAASVPAQTARSFVPAEQAASWTVPANWAMAHGLSQAFEEKVLSQR
jgi:multiple sugar transport system substrate-binding protein/putative spermidine/putrescine transport system substrate-binding protein